MKSCQEGVQHLTAQGFTVWWDRVSMPSRALTFMQEIRDAIHNAERLLLIVGPKALSSDYVRAEWQHALADNKVVIPVLRLGGYDEFPRRTPTSSRSVLPERTRVRGIARRNRTGVARSHSASWNDRRQSARLTTALPAEDGGDEQARRGSVQGHSGSGRRHRTFARGIAAR